MPTTHTISVSTPPHSGAFTKETLIHGRPARIDCIRIADQTYSITGGPIAIARLEDEWYEDVKDPDAVIAFLNENPEFKPDIVTFWQRLPDLTPKYPFHLEWDHIAAMPTSSYNDWFQHHIKPRVRTSIRKAEKEGVVVKETVWDDAFVRLVLDCTGRELDEVRATRAVLYLYDLSASRGNVASCGGLGAQ